MGIVTALRNSRRDSLNAVSSDDEGDVKLALYYIVFIALYCIVLYYIALYYIGLYCIALCCIVLY